MNESSAVSFFINFLQINHQLAGIVFGEGEDFGAKESNDVVRDDGDGFVLKIRVIDAEARVEPLDLIGNKLSGDEALRSG